jgi:hypothetical protein
MSASALVDCQFGSWYPRYAALAPEAEVIPLSDEFAAFLLEDGIVLADDSDAVRHAAGLARGAWPHVCNSATWICAARRVGGCGAAGGRRPPQLGARLAGRL